MSVRKTICLISRVRTHSFFSVRIRALKVSSLIILNVVLTGEFGASSNLGIGGVYEGGGGGMAQVATRRTRFPKRFRSLKKGGLDDKYGKSYAFGALNTLRKSI